jgi:two-component system NarL family response regulator/two-component system response regulator DevR
MPVKVFIVDDHELVREALSTLLESDEEVQLVGEAATGRDALTKLASTQTDVALLDLRLPDIDGIELCREIGSAHPEIRCLILTGQTDDSFAAEAILAGAAGYITKGVRIKELAGIIQRVAAGGSMIDPDAAHRLLTSLRKETNRSSDEPHLTPQEARTLELIGEGLTNREIANRLNLAEQTVKNYVSNILAKLGFSRRTQAAVYAVRLQEEMD